jgi:hypothetical protein
MSLLSCQLSVVGCFHLFSSLSYGAAATAFVVVLVPYKILIHEDEHEDEYEKNQIRSHASAPASAG